MICQCGIHAIFRRLNGHSMIFIPYGKRNQSAFGQHIAVLSDGICQHRSYGRIMGQGIMIGQVKADVDQVIILSCTEVGQSQIILFKIASGIRKTIEIDCSPLTVFGIKERRIHLFSLVIEEGITILEINGRDGDTQEVNRFCLFICRHTISEDEDIDSFPGEPANHILSRCLIIIGKACEIDGIVSSQFFIAIVIQVIGIAF